MVGCWKVGKEVVRLLEKKKWCVEVARLLEGVVEVARLLEGER